MTTDRLRRGGQGALLTVALMLGLGTSCAKSVNYTYVNVDVNVDSASLDASHLYLVTSCEFFVSGADASGSGYGLQCRENNVPNHVGTFQWSSQATSGTLQFTVKLFDANHEVLGSGTSDSVGIAPGKHLETSVLVLGVTPPDGNPGGTPDAGGEAGGEAGGNDGSTDAAVTSDAGPDLGAVDMLGAADTGAIDTGNDTALD